jgi:hypothetical protein
MPTTGFLELELGGRAIGEVGVAIVSMFVGNLAAADDSETNRHAAISRIADQLSICPCKHH